MKYIPSMIILLCLLHPNLEISLAQELTASYVQYLPWITHPGQKEQHSGAVYNDLIHILAEKLQLAINLRRETNFAASWDSVCDEYTSFVKYQRSQNVQISI